VVRDVVVGVEGCSCLVRDVVVSCELETEVSAILNGKHLQYTCIYYSASSPEVNNSLAVLKFCEQTVSDVVYYRPYPPATTTGHFLL